MLYLLPQAVDRAARTAPGRDAIRCAGASLTYEELATRSTRLANLLTEMGVGRGDRVAICAKKGLEAATAMYGIMKAGAAYVPLDPAAPSERLGLILTDCGIRHVVAEPSRASTLAAVAEAGAAFDAVVGLDDGSGPDAPTATWDDVAGAPDTDPAPGTTEQDLAYVLYTSGSTGTPKGVMHTHRSALAWAEVSSLTYGLRPDDRLSNHAPLHFDLSTLDYFAAAVAGATTVVVPEAHARLPASFSQLIEAERITVLFTVPLALTQLLTHGALEARDVSSVRWVLFGGEPFPTKHLRSLMDAMPAARFSNVYGPTEVNGVTYWIVPPLPGDSDHPIPIGHAFPNVDLLVVDEDDQAVAEGATGELLARTPTMMKGYWRRPELDARAFWRRAGAGGYDEVYHRTGDLVKKGPEGLLEFLGRKDRQVKVRGYRIELDEIEVALNAHAAVETAAVFVVPAEEGGRRIAAAVKLSAGEAAQANELLDHAARRLPAYALPEHLEIVSDLPTTSTGKIDRLSLRARAAGAKA